MFCPKCGNMLPEASSFCSKCGTSMKQSTPNENINPLLYDQDTPTQAFTDVNTYQDDNQNTATCAQTPQEASLEQTSYEQAAYGQTSYEQTPYGQAPFGQAAYGQASYGQAPSGQATYNQAPYGQAPSGQATYGQASYGQAPSGQATYGQAPFGQATYNQAPYGQAPLGQPPYNQAPYGQAHPQYQMGGIMRGGYSYNSDSMLFRNPHTGLLAFIVILGFLTAIFCNCGLIKFHPDLSRWESDLKAFAFLPMWFIAIGCINIMTNDQYHHIRIVSLHEDNTALYTALTIFFVVMAVLALISFIKACIIAGKSSLKYRSPRSQLRSMNSFLILNWIFWLLYTALILLPTILAYEEIDRIYFFLQYSIFGYLYTGCLIVMTIMKCIYSKKITAAYAAYEQKRTY